MGTPLLLVALCAVGCADTGHGDPGAAPGQARASSSSSAPRARPAAARRARSSAQSDPAGTILTTPILEGRLVRVYRRPVTSGLIRVRDERVSNEGAASELLDELRAQGWRRWPPPPAPEMAAALAEAHPALRDCPFLLEVSEEPESWALTPRQIVTCFDSVPDLEVAIARESLLRFRRAQALPCGNLANVDPRKDGPHERELRAHCAAMGVTVETLTAQAAEPELARRTKLNGTLTRAIRR